MKPHDTYKDWIQKERNGFWTNTITNESTIWHPMTIEITGPLYKESAEWCRKVSDARNKLIREKRS